MEISLLTGLFVGPIIHYCATIVLYRLGAVSMNGLTSRAFDTLVMGAIAGGLAAAVCQGRAISPALCAKWVGIIALALWAIPYGTIAVVSQVNPRVYITLSTIVVVMAGAALITGYFGTVVTRRLFPTDWKVS